MNIPARSPSSHFRNTLSNSDSFRFQTLTYGEGPRDYARRRIPRRWHALLTAGRDGTVKEWTEPAPRPTLDGLDASDALADRLQRLFAADFTSGTDWREMWRGCRLWRSRVRRPACERPEHTSRVKSGKRPWRSEYGMKRVDHSAAPIEAAIRPSKISSLSFSRDRTRSQYILPAPLAVNCNPA